MADELNISAGKGQSSPSHGWSQGQAQAEPAGQLQQVNPPHWVGILIALRQRVAGLIPSSWSRLPFDMFLKIRSLEHSSYARFRSGIIEPTCCYLLSAAPAGSAPADNRTAKSMLETLWLELSPQITHPLLDMMLGGSGQVSSAGRPVTAIQHRLLQKVVDVFACRLTAGWNGTMNFSCRIVSDLQGRQAMRLMAPDETTAIVTMDLSAGQCAGPLRLCLPCPLLETSLPACRLDSPAHQGPIEVAATTEDMTLTADELSNLAPGDILVTETPSDGEIILRLAGIPKYRARLGASEGRRAVTITGPVQGDPPAPPKPS